MFKPSRELALMALSASPRAKATFCQRWFGGLKGSVFCEQSDILDDVRLMAAGYSVDSAEFNDGMAKLCDAFALSEKAGRLASGGDRTGRRKAHECLRQSREIRRQ